MSVTYFNQEFWTNILKDNNADNTAQEVCWEHNEEVARRHSSQDALHYSHRHQWSTLTHEGYYLRHHLQQQQQQQQGTVKTQHISNLNERMLD
jgi:hypothetical protein